MCLCMSVFVCVRVCACVFVRVCVSVHVCLCVCLYLGFKGADIIIEGLYILL